MRIAIAPPDTSMDWWTVVEVTHSGIVKFIGEGGTYNPDHPEYRAMDCWLLNDHPYYTSEDNAKSIAKKWTMMSFEDGTKSIFIPKKVKMSYQLVD